LEAKRKADEEAAMKAGTGKISSGSGEDLLTKMR
jgi:hypothetical protein